MMAIGRDSHENLTSNRQRRNVPLVQTFGGLKYYEPRAYLHALLLQAATVTNVTRRTYPESE